MQEDKKQNLQIKSLYNLFATLALILLILAGALTYLTNAIDISVITRPFEVMSQEARQDLSRSKGTKAIAEKMPQSSSGSENWFSELRKKDEERNRNVTGVKPGAEEKAQKASEKKGPLGAVRKLQVYYIKFKLMIERFENYIADIPYKPVIILIIWALFFIKGYVSITPLSFTCFLTGLIFPFWLAILINLVGIVYTFSSKYIKGAKSEKNTVHKYLTKWKRLGKLIEDSENGDGTGNPGLLFILRLAPSVPLNTVSTLYGYMGFKYWWYLIISLLGYSIKLITFTSIGANIDDPFSLKFVLPILIILYMTGIAMAVLAIVYKHKMNVMAEPVETY